MVGDLLSASPCEVLVGSASSFVASFLDTVQAVSAARRLMRLVQGFSQASKAVRLQGCFILSTAEEGNLEVESQLKQLPPVLALAHNGLLLVVGSLYESARSIPGLRFEALLVEWLKPETNSLYQPVMQLMPPAVECRPQLPIASEFASPAFVADMSVTGRINAVVSPPATEPVMPAGREIAEYSRIQRSAGRTFPLSWIALGCAAVVMLAAIAFRFSGSRSPQHPAASPPPLVQPAPVPAPPVSATVPLHPSPPPQQPKVVATPVQPKPQVSARDVAPPKRPASNPPPPKSVHPIETGGGTTTVSGEKSGTAFSPDEIKFYLQQADKDSGDGKYNVAINIYNTVLQHDPSNAQAKEGLARAIANRDSK
jgi:hypothetical protein